MTYHDHIFIQASPLLPKITFTNYAPKLKGIVLLVFLFFGFFGSVESGKILG